MRYLLLLLICANANATTWYVDNAASGANSGVSWANAWQSFAAINWAGGGVTGGDTVYVSGGTTSKTYYEFLWIKNSGSAGNIITFSVGVDAGHTGRVIQDGVYTNTATISGTEYGAVVCGESYVRLTGGASTNWTIYRWGTNSVDREKGIAFYGGAGGFHTIDGVTFSNMNNGIMHNSSAATNILIYNCAFYNIGGDYAIRYVAQTGSTATNFQFCVISNVYAETLVDLTQSNPLNDRGGPDGLQCSSGVTMHHCVFRSVGGTVSLGQHPDGIQAADSYCKFFDNQFWNYANSGYKPEPNNPSWKQWKEMYFYNNVIGYDTQTNYNWAVIRSGGGTGMEIGGTLYTQTNMTNVVIANNTIIDVPHIGISGGGGCGTNVSQLILFNNIIYNCGSNSFGGVMGPPTMSVDYNLINAGAQGNGVIRMSDDCIGSNYTNDVQNHHFTGAPLFVSYTFLSGRTNNLRLSSSDTAAKGLGTNCVAWIPAVDFYGTARTWSIGAFEETGAASLVGGATLNASGTARVGVMTVP